MFSCSTGAVTELSRVCMYVLPDRPIYMVHGMLEHVPRHIHDETTVFQ